MDEWKGTLRDFRNLSWNWSMKYIKKVILFLINYMWYNLFMILRANHKILR